MSDHQRGTCSNAIFVNCQRSKFPLLKSFVFPLTPLFVCLFAFFGSSSAAFAADVILPDLGGAGSGLISPRQEYELGQRWLRIYRAQVPTTSDPFLQAYTENLVQKLSAYSDLQDKRLDVLVVENPTLNAFAVPGGIIGVNTGLFEHASTEDQFASVLAHELAHLSQRHYARRLADQKEKSIPTMAAMLASILIAASAGGDAGIAAISATNALALDSQLRFSRGMEQEADRIGMETLAKSGKDPFAMPAMFENMLHASRYSQRPPEFLLTHPLTESRVSDAHLRAQQFQKRYFPPSDEYHLARVRAEILHESNINFALRHFASELKGTKYQPKMASYGLVLAQTRAGRLAEATKTLEPLLLAEPDNLYFVIAQAEIEAEQEDFTTATKRLEDKLKHYPNHHALNIRYAEILMKASNYAKAQQILMQHSTRRPKDDYVWYLLAEVHGLAGNIFQVHSARAEYFMLNGLYDKAIIQLKNARRLVEEDRHELARLDLRLKEARKLREEGGL